MYHFRQINQREAFIGTGLLQLPDSAKEQEMSSGAAFGEYMAAFHGALLALFGEPLMPAGDCRYDYALEARDSANRTWLLNVHDASAPGIGGNAEDPSIYAVALALRDLIESTTPLDFEHTYYAEDYETTVTYGCKAGQCYWYEARGRRKRVTQKQHLQREAREKAEFNAYMAKCEAEDICSVCNGKGYIGRKKNNSLCPECRGSGKPSDWS